VIVARGWLVRALDAVERIGNRLPHPASLFVLLSLLVVFSSWLVQAAGWTVVHPTSGAAVGATNLFSLAGLHRVIEGFVPNFLTFGPFGPVLVCLLGLSVAEHAGLLSAVVRVVVGATSPRFLTLVIVFTGAMSHTAGDVGYVLLLPLAAALFHTVGRHPIAGLAAAYAGVSGGFAANMLLSPTDVTLAAITQDAARIVDATYTVTPMASYYFLACSVLLVTATGTVVTERLVEPRLGPYRGDAVPTPAEPLTALERAGLRWATLAVLGLVVVVALGLWPRVGFLLDAGRPGFLGSYLVRGLVFWIFVFGLVPGVVYGIVAGTIRRDRDVYAGMTKNMEVVAGYIVAVFFIAQFVNLFAWSGLGVLAAVKGAAWLEAAGLGAIPLLVGLVLLTASIDLVMGSASAKWAMLGTVMVPMFMLLGYSPELTQTAYRLGDSLTNIITPLSANFPLVLLFFQRYEAKAGIGTLSATMLPYTLVNTVAWTLFLVLWVWLGIPTGPAAPLFIGR
jgi:aminobenzoyl-glutamate transport protein